MAKLSFEEDMLLGTAAAAIVLAGCLFLVVWVLEPKIAAREKAARDD